MCSQKQKYSQWFEFAERCLNKNNQSEDFEKYRKDEVFLEMMRRLQADKATPDDFQIIDLYEQIANTEEELQAEKKRAEQEKKRAEQEKKRAEQEKKRAEQEEQKRLIAAKTMKDDGMPIALIARYLGLNIDVIDGL